MIGPGYLELQQRKGLILKKVFAIAFALYHASCAVKNPNIILSWYVIKNDPLTVNEMLVKGALVDGKKSDNYTPLMIAAWMGNLDIVKLLIDSGASVNRVSHDQISPIIFATIKNHQNVVEYLLDKGANPVNTPEKQFNAIQISQVMGYEALSLQYSKRGFGAENKIIHQRSTDDIISIVRVNSIGLKIIYDKHLHKRPGFKGKVNLKFSIRPDGSIDQITVAKSTTKYQEFDDSIIREAKTWRFITVNSENNDVVTVPFTFSE
jgi:TonB family protein